MASFGQTYPPRGRGACARPKAGRAPALLPGEPTLHCEKKEYSSTNRDRSEVAPLLDPAVLAPVSRCEYGNYVVQKTLLLAPRDLVRLQGWGIPATQGLNPLGN